MLNYRNVDLKGVRLVARALAKEAAGRDMVVGLSGDLGAGKTTFTQAFAKELGVKNLNSPTFIVVATHRLPKKDLYHIDFYRLRSKSELDPLGIQQIMESGNRIALIEWVDRFPSVKKNCDILIDLKITGKGLRDLTIRHNK